MDKAKKPKRRPVEPKPSLIVGKTFYVAGMFITVLR